MPRNADPLRIVLEGTGGQFRAVCQAWAGNEKLEIEDEDEGMGGRFVILKVPPKRLATVTGALKSSAPAGMYRATVPPEEAYGLPTVIPGPAYEGENARLEKAHGRHVLLATPPKVFFEELRKRKKEANAAGQTR